MIYLIIGVLCAPFLVFLLCRYANKDAVDFKADLRTIKLLVTCNPKRISSGYDVGIWTYCKAHPGHSNDYYYFSLTIPAWIWLHLHNPEKAKIKRKRNEYLIIVLEDCQQEIDKMREEANAQINLGKKLNEQVRMRLEEDE